eukprot:m.104077 g.104077  ORF g.104077 m.104077 type:complete len:76 (-) comp15618_c1_seq1:1667-1894(-)
MIPNQILHAFCSFSHNKWVVSPFSPPSVTVLVLFHMQFDFQRGPPFAHSRWATFASLAFVQRQLTMPALCVCVMV